MVYRDSYKAVWGKGRVIVGFLLLFLWDFFVVGVQLRVVDVQESKDWKVRRLADTDLNYIYFTYTIASNLQEYANNTLTKATNIQTIISFLLNIIYLPIFPLRYIPSPTQ